MKKQISNTTIFLLGGWITKDKDEWRTVNFCENLKIKEQYEIYGGRLSVIAVSYLYNKNNKIKIIASGGTGQLTWIKNAPNVSKVIKGELIKLGIPSNKIKQEKRSNNTYEQLLELKQLVKKLKWEEVIILSNKYHLPRIKAMIKYAPKLKSTLKMTTILFKSAEKICLMNNNKKWQKIIKKAYCSQAMIKTIKLEKKGIRKIKNGTYNYKIYAN